MSSNLEQHGNLHADALAFSLITPFKSPGGRMTIEMATLASDPSLDLDDPDFDVELDATLCGGPLRKSLSATILEMIGSEIDPFQPDEHFKPNPTPELISILLHRSEDENCEAPVGYATISATFTREDEGTNDSGPSYNLYINPIAIFVSEPERGNGFGVWLAAAMAQSVTEAITALARQAAETDVMPHLDIIARIEANASGVDSATGVFKSHLDAFWQTLPEVVSEQDELSLDVGDLDFDEVW